MTITRPTYATRRQVKFATDIATTAAYDAQVDSALCQAADDVDALCRRRFYNVTTTAYWDWPNFQRAYPWRIWFNERELADVTTTVPVVKAGTAGGTVAGTLIPNTAVFWGHPNYSPPYTYLELDRSQSYTFGGGNTPQRDVSIQGVYGYWAQTRPGGSLAAAVTDTTGTTITVTDGSLVDAGDYITIGTESMLVTDYAFATTGQTNVSGITTASASDATLTVTDGTKIHAGEILQIDSESMLAKTVTGNNVAVERGYDGSILATHSAGTTVYAQRSLTVTRGDFGTTAATHLISAAITVLTYPGTVRELALAEALNTVLQKTTGYARGMGENMRTIPGGSLPDLRKRCWSAFGRKHRQQVV